MLRLIFGKKKMGKSTLAAHLARLDKNKGFPTLWVTPYLNDPILTVAAPVKVTASIDEAMAMLKNKSSRQVKVTVDEGGQTIERHNPRTEEMATGGRHWGGRDHDFTVICQDATLINKNFRRQADEAIVFRQFPESCKLLAEQFNEPRLLAASRLKAGQYLWVVEEPRSIKFGSVNWGRFRP